MGEPLMQSVHPGLDDVGWSIHVGLADLQVNDASSLPFQSAGANQHFKGGFRSQARHPLGQAQFSLCSSHRQTQDYNATNIADEMPASIRHAA